MTSGNEFKEYIPVNLCFDSDSYRCTRLCCRVYLCLDSVSYRCTRLSCPVYLCLDSYRCTKLSCPGSSTTWPVDSRRSPSFWSMSDYHWSPRSTWYRGWSRSPWSRPAAGVRTSWLRPSSTTCWRPSRRRATRHHAPSPAPHWGCQRYKPPSSQGLAKVQRQDHYHREGNKYQRTNF